MVRRVASFLVLGLLFAPAAYAQLASQTALVGTVTDAGGLVLPGAWGRFAEQRRRALVVAAGEYPRSARLG